MLDASQIELVASDCSMDSTGVWEPSSKCPLGVRQQSMAEIPNDIIDMALLHDTYSYAVLLGSYSHLDVVLKHVTCKKKSFEMTDSRVCIASRIQAHTSEHLNV